MSSRLLRNDTASARTDYLMPWLPGSRSSEADPKGDKKHTCVHRWSFRVFEALSCNTETTLSSVSTRLVASDNDEHGIRLVPIVEERAKARPVAGACSIKVRNILSVLSLGDHDALAVSTPFASTLACQIFVSPRINRTSFFGPPKVKLATPGAMISPRRSPRGVKTCTPDADEV